MSAKIVTGRAVEKVTTIRLACTRWCRWVQLIWLVAFNRVTLYGVAAYAILLRQVIDELPAATE